MEIILHSKNLSVILVKCIHTYLMNDTNRILPPMTITKDEKHNKDSVNIMRRGASDPIRDKSVIGRAHCKAGGDEQIKHKLPGLSKKWSAKARYRKRGRYRLHDENAIFRNRR